MESRFQPCIPLPLDRETLNDIVSKSKDWALMHGAGMRSKTNFSSDSLVFAPFALLPSVFPKREFERAVELQPIINELMFNVAHDHNFLTENLKNTIEVDDFTRRLFQLYEIMLKEGFTQPISLGCIRSDLMLESQCNCCEKEKCSSNCCTSEMQFCCWKQVEVNTIASGFGWLGPASGYLQSFVLKELGYPNLVENLPANNALQGLAQGIIDAWKIYDDPSAVVLFVVEDVTYNICDQRFLEFEIRSLNPNVRVIRRTLTELSILIKFGSKKELIVGNEKVAVVYFRAGYEPGHYPSEKEWEARHNIEKSLAIKCPSIQYHLAGTKKVQQALARPGVLNKFLNDHQVESVKGIFTGLYSLDYDEYGDAAFKMALLHPEKFVLKPQREGGGNNVYGEEVRDALKKMENTKERPGWILMDRIIPPVQANYIVRAGVPVQDPCDLVSELGIFGVIIAGPGKILINKQVGHMLRSKLSSANEGGVAAGLGALDSPYLV
uniref:Glutathione synthetase n=3 Tax=Clastoptera arizonana TaxID=38151 RepID=A0A1B6DXB3_9HEMI